MTLARLLAALIASLTLARVFAAELPRVFTLDPAALASAHERLAHGDAALAPALARLRSEADALLTARPASVLDKTKTAASGDKHDYFSFGPYWWPDPAKPNGLPYLQRDGQVNPESRQGTDAGAFGRTCSAVETLGLAFWFTGDPRYAAKAAQLTRVWFLDPATRMNPNLQHAQAIPGRTDGRGIGILDAHVLADLTDGLALLAGSPAWTDADATAMAAWLATYYVWLTTSANGHDEQAANNNHGSWFDAQAAHLALVLGKDADAKAIATAALTRRIAKQIEPDGRQPLELARTNSLHYSLYNLEPLVRLARVGQHVGVDLWAFSTSDGRSLRAALRYLAPFVDPAKKWPKEDLRESNRADLLPFFAEALAHGDDPEFRALLEKFSTPATAAERWHLTTRPPAP
jgi:hypothetical protein